MLTLTGLRGDFLARAAGIAGLEHPLSGRIGPWKTTGHAQRITEQHGL